MTIESAKPSSGAADPSRKQSNSLWEAADRLRGDAQFDVGRVVTAARSHGPVSWRDFADVAMADRTAGLGRPLHLLNFLAALAQRMSPRSIIDPFVTSPSPLAVIAEAAPNARAVGLVPNQMVAEIGLVIAPAVDWSLGDPLTALSSDGADPDDLVLLSPPLGMRLPESLTDQAPALARGDVADYLLLHSLKRVGATGRLLYHCTDSLFWKRGGPLLDACASAGLHLTAVVSIDRGFGPHTAVQSSLVLFERQPTDELFVGRLDERTPVTALADNLLARQSNPGNFHLGVLADRTYRGWQAFVLQRELLDAFGAEQLVSIGELGSVRSLTLRPNAAYEAPLNTVVVPGIGTGDVLTYQPTYEGKNPYRLLEIQLDPDKARAEYVAALLSSPVGKRLRMSASTGSTLPRIDAASLADIRIPMPALPTQQEALVAAGHLASMEATVGRLRSDLWRRPAEAKRVIAQLESAAKLDPVRRWLEALPYPLASVLQRYVALRDPEARVQSLINFFEAMAQFGCAVLLSVFRADPVLFEEVRADLAKAAPPGRKLLDRADFGLWLGLGQTLARNVRRLSNDKAQQDSFQAAVGPAGALVNRLSDKTVWALLDRARTVRNQRAHSGMVSDNQLLQWLSSLEALLGDVEQALGTAFEDVDLALADQASYRGGVYTYRTAARLRGANAIFEQFEVRTREPLESEHLTFVARDILISPVLKLVPLVRVGPVPASARTACYFFESRRDGAVSYVSYHFEGEPRVQLNDADLEELVREIDHMPNEPLVP